MWIARLIGEPVVAAVRAHPEEERPLKCHRAGDHQHALEESGRLERFVRSIAMEPNGYAEHLNRVEHREERVVECGSPAGERQIEGDRESDGRMGLHHGMSDFWHGDVARHRYTGMGARHENIQVFGFKL